MYYRYTEEKIPDRPSSERWQMISEEDLFTGYRPRGRRGPGREETGAFAQLLRMTDDYRITDRERANAFLEQARLMESYDEENDIPDVDHYHAYVGYQEMDPRELHAYFSWRTRFRRGERVPFHISFILLHAAELINQIGTGSREEAFGKLLRLMQVGQEGGTGLSDGRSGRGGTGLSDGRNLRSRSGLPERNSPGRRAGLLYDDNSWGRNGLSENGSCPRISPDDRRRLDRILSDYVISWGPSEELVQAYCISDIQRETINITLLHPAESNDATIFEMIRSLVDRRTLGSVFLEQAGEDGWRVIARVFRTICLEQKKAGRPVLSERLLGARRIRQRPLFPYIPYAASVEEEYEIEVSPATSYLYQDGQWYRSSYSVMRNDDALRELNAIVRECDRVLRKKMRFRSQLPDRMKNPWLEKLIGDEFDHWIRERELRNRPEVRVDLSKLGKIRNQADITRDRLLEGTQEDMAESLNLTGGMNDPVLKAEESPEEVRQGESLTEKNLPEDGLPEEDQAEVICQNEDSPDTDLAGSIFNDQEGAFLRILLSGGSGASFFRGHKVIPSIFVDEINEKAYDEIGDSIVEEDGSGWRIIEDYTEDIKRLLPFPDESGSREAGEDT